MSHNPSHDNMEGKDLLSQASDVEETNEGVSSKVPLPSRLIASTVVSSGGVDVVAPHENAPVVSQQEALSDAEVEAQMRRMSRRSFLWAALTVGATYGGWRWLVTRRTDDGTLWPLRRALQWNEDLARDYFKTARLAPTFDASRIARPARTNGDIGLGDDFEPGAWQLQVDGLANQNQSSRMVSLAEIKALPRVDMITELKCIEGWSMIVKWTGARLSDFMEKYPPATLSGDALDLKSRPDDAPSYVGMETPDGAYYVGIEREAALHPQTLLCYEMNGQPLTLEHGAPLRLAIPVKYGIKNIKRIGAIHYTNERPRDYWAEQGYDYYAGH